MTAGATHTTARATDLAVIGMACRLPGAADYRAYWELLLQGRDAIVEIPDDRWLARETFTSDIGASGKALSRWGGLLNDVMVFDHAFFNISPREARQMDPQQRLLLQEAWHCVEDSAVPLKVLQAARTNVCIGVMAIDYYRKSGRDDALVDAYSAVGNYECILANRISHVLGLRGESKAIDTACSSSLVAIADARRALLAGECDYALAGGVSLILDPFRYISFSKARMLSSDGRCKTFDASANGYVPGEGVGLILLRRLEDALRDGDVIHAVIKGCAVNHNAGARDITAPSISAQVDVVTAAHRAAGLLPSQVGYIEAHGTGTSLGDPIEVEALHRWRSAATPPGTSLAECFIGSVKTNIGHLEAAAGVAGLLKVVLMTQHRMLVPTLNLRDENPLIDFGRTGLRPVLRAEPWHPTVEGEALVAGVSSFGFGGVNAHAVVAGYQGGGVAPHAEPSASRPHALALSAHDAAGLARLVGQWAAFSATPECHAHTEADIEAVLLTGRQPLAARTVVWFDRVRELPRLLHAEAQRLAGAPAGRQPTQVPVVIDVGGDVHALGRLLDRMPGGPDTTAQLAHAELVAGSHAAPSATRRAFARAVAVVVRLNRLLPRACWHARGAGWWVVCAALDCVPQDEALAGFAEGRRGPVYLSPKHVPSLLTGAGASGPTLDAEVLQGLARRAVLAPEEIDRAWRKARLLSVHQHSFRHFLAEWNAALGMDTLAILGRHATPDEWRKAAAGAREILSFAIAVLSSLRRLDRRWSLERVGSVGDAGTAILLDMLADQVLAPGDFLAMAADRSTARIDEDVQRKLLDWLADRPDAAEWLWPNPTLEVIDGAPEESSAAITAWRAVRRGVCLDLAAAADGPSHGALFAAVLQVWSRGGTVDWLGWFSAGGHRRLALPGLPFGGSEHRMLPLPPTGTPAGATTPVAGHAVLQHDAVDEARFDARADAVLRDHVIGMRSLLPAAAMLALPIEAVCRAGGFVPLVLREAAFVAPGLPSPLLALRTAFVADRGAFEVATAGERLCIGRLAVLAGDSPVPTAPIQGGQPIEAWYATLDARGYRYGPKFRVVRRALTLPDGSVHADLSLHAEGSWPRSLVDPGLLDGVFQCALMAGGMAQAEAPALWVPAALSTLRLHAPLDRDCRVVVPGSAVRRRGDSVTADAVVLSPEGGVVAELEGLVFLPAPPGLAATPPLSKDEATGSPAICYRPAWRVLASEDRIARAGGAPAVVLCPRLADAAEDTAARLAQALDEAGFASRIERFDVTESGIDALCDRLWQGAKAQASYWFVSPLLALHAAAGVAELSQATSCSSQALVLLVAGLLRGQRRGLVLPGVLTAVSRDAWVVEPEDGGRGWFAAGYAGLARTLAAESRQLRVRVLDLDCQSWATSSLSAALLAPWPEDDDGACLVAFRSGRRHVAGAARAEVPAGSAPYAARAGGVYLLTGGMGGIGRRLAIALSKQAPCTLVLVGRSPVDAPALGALRQLVAPGSTVEAWTGDIGDENDLHRVFERIDQRFGRLDGVFHGAGVLRDGLLSAKTPDAVSAVLHPKVQGTWLLLRMARRFAPEVFVAFSSVVAWLGNIGQADYAAANSALEALLNHAAANRHSSTRYLAVAWTLWAEGGMGLSEPIVAQFTRRGLPPIRSGPALEAMFSNLSGDTSVVAVCAAAVQALERPRAQAGKPPRSSPAPGGHFMTPSVPIDAIRRAVSEVLDVPIAELEDDVPLRQYGVDSVSTSVLADRLGALRGAAVLPTLVLEAPTIAALAQALASAPARATQPLQMSAPAPQPAPKPGSGTALAERLLAKLQRDRAGVPAPGKVPAEPVALAPASAGPSTSLFEAASRVLADVLGIDQRELERDVPLRSYGIDSVSMSLFSDRLAAATGLPLSPAALIEHPTLGQLAAWLATQAKVAQCEPATAEPADRQTEAHRLRAGAPLRDDRIAIIGCAARMPGSEDLHAFWRHLEAGTDLVREVPASRMHLSFREGKAQDGYTYSRWAGLLDQPYHFDARFFKLGDAEALQMDPQQRVFLELVQHLWDDAGYASNELRGSRTGVFVGANESNYARSIAGRRKFNGRTGVVDVIPNMIPGRVADFYDLRGPAWSVYTACSSSLVALYQAVGALQRGDCDLAVAGGIELLLDDEWFVGFSGSQALSVDGRCKVFDESANGFVLGEGAGAVLLKRCDAAVTDGDRILAVVDGIGINNDGATMGLTTPNMDAQQRLIEQVLDQARVRAESVSYFEAHGTGTSLGDPVEMRAASRAYRRFTQQTGFCALGSVKSNVGHLLSAAGIASLAKVLMSLRHRRLPATLHCHRPNPKFEFGSSPFRPLQAACDWRDVDGVRRAAISSFGFGGTNVHCIVSGMADDARRVRRVSRELTRFDRRAYRLDGTASPPGSAPWLDRLFAEGGLAG